MSQHPTEQIERYLKRQGILFEPVQEEATVDDIVSGKPVGDVVSAETVGDTVSGGPVGDLVSEEMVNDIVSGETVDPDPQEEARNVASDPRRATDSVLSPTDSPTKATFQDASEAEEATFSLNVSNTGEENNGKCAASLQHYPSYSFKYPAASTRRFLDITTNGGTSMNRSTGMSRSTSPKAGKKPSTFNEFKEMESAFLSVDLPSTVFVSKDSKANTAFIGELYVRTTRPYEFSVLTHP